MIKNVHKILDLNHAAKLLPNRTPKSNKGTYGKVLFIGGNDGMAGAAYFACKSAYRIGCGLVYAMTSLRSADHIQILLPEAVSLPIDMNDITPKDRRIISTHLRSVDSVILGPGLGTGENIKRLVTLILNKVSSPIIIDADGLNHISDNINILKDMKDTPIITPHPGEMSRLIGKSIDYVTKNIAMIATDFSQKYGCITVLKDHETVIAAPNGTLYINKTGCSALAKGGTGDVLSGIIGGLTAQGCSSIDAAILGVYIHGMAGDLAAKNYTEYSLLAGELADHIPIAIKQLLKLT